MKIGIGSSPCSRLCKQNLFNHLKVKSNANLTLIDTNEVYYDSLINLINALKNKEIDKAIFVEEMGTGAQFIIGRYDSYKYALVNNPKMLESMNPLKEWDIIIMGTTVLDFNQIAEIAERYVGA